MELREWLEAYARAWCNREPDSVVALFTEDASYRSSPFREPSLGHDGIRAYWARATGSQEEVDVRMGEPLVDGRFVAVEWWATMRSEGEEAMLPGCLLLRFAPEALLGSPRVLERRRGPSASA